METGTNSPQQTQPQSKRNGSSEPEAQSRAFMRRVEQARDAVRQRTKRLPELWSLVKRRPVIGVAAAVGGGLGLAAAIGAAEVAVALTAGLLAYQALTKTATQ